MTGATIELGGNALTLGLSIITLATLVFNNLSSRRAATAAESTEDRGPRVLATLGRLEEGHTVLIEGQDRILARLDDHEQRIIRIEAKAS